MKISFVFISILCIYFSVDLIGQDYNTGTICYEVENIDSIFSYFSKREDLLEAPDAPLGEIDSSGAQIRPFIGQIYRRIVDKNYCVLFNHDSILIEERIGSELEEKYLITKRNEEITGYDPVLGYDDPQPYYIEASDSLGYFDYVIQIASEDVLNIQGFDCHRIDIIEYFYAKGVEKPFQKFFQLYVTDKIVMSASYILGLQLKRDLGCPLRFETYLDRGLKVVFQANKWDPESYKLSF